MSSINISSQNVQVNPTTTENKINVVTTTENNVTVTQPSIQTVEVLTGPQGPAGSSDPVYSNSTTVTYTSANILSLDEIIVLPAPSSSQYYEFKAIVEYDFGSTPYTSSGGFFGTGILQFTDAIIAGSLGSVPTESVDKVLGFNEGVNPEATALKFKISRGTFTGGDGEFKLKIQYNTSTLG